MIELKITGETPKEFYASCVNTLVMLLRPPQAAAPVVDKVEEQVIAEAVAEPLANPSAKDAPPEGEPKPEPKKRGRKPAEAKTEPATVHNDPIPDFLTGEPAKDAAPTAEPAKTYTIDDCRDALRQVFANFEQRARAKVENYGSLKGAALTEVESKIMREKVEYAKPLIYDFGVQKIGDLRAEQYAQFMVNALPYIKGEK